MKSARKPIADRTPLFRLSDLEANETPLKKKERKRKKKKKQHPDAFILALVRDGEGGLNMMTEDHLHSWTWGEGILALGKEIPRMHCPCKPERCRQEMVL